MAAPAYSVIVSSFSQGEYKMHTGKEGPPIVK